MVNNFDIDCICFLLFFIVFYCFLLFFIVFKRFKENIQLILCSVSEVAQRKRVWLITRRAEDRNLPSLYL